VAEAERVGVLVVAEFGFVGPVHGERPVGFGFGEVVPFGELGVVGPVPQVVWEGPVIVDRFGFDGVGGAER
jgi:hypothetical protein